MAQDFDKWWNDLKKHRKRLNHWLRHARDLSERHTHWQGLRYFTLCARPMIDVFLLAKEKLVSREDQSGRILGVSFCELNQEHYPEIIELIGIESAGFQCSLEELVLFKDDDYTSQFPTVESIQEEIELQGEGIDSIKRDQLVLKRQHFAFCDKFPFDFLNLDFCEHYYPDPPGILEINETVQNIVGLQTKSCMKDHQGFNEFILSVTCRYDDAIPDAALTRLENIVRHNKNNFPEYQNAMTKTKGTDNTHAWRDNDLYDFFVSAWPKEILSIGKNEGWNAQVKDLVHYDRIGDSGRQYKMVCLVALFSHPGNMNNYSSEAIRTLHPNSRTFIDEIARDGDEGIALLQNLQEVVTMRNIRAQFVGRPLLPEP